MVKTMTMEKIVYKCVRVIEHFANSEKALAMQLEKRYAKGELGTSAYGVKETYISPVIKEVTVIEDVNQSNEIDSDIKTDPREDVSPEREWRIYVDKNYVGEFEQKETITTLIDLGMEAVDIYAVMAMAMRNRHSAIVRKHSYSYCVIVYRIQ